MDWAADLLGLTPAFKFGSKLGGGGVLQTTASDSAFLACMVARIRFTRAHPDVPAEKLVLYITTQTHSLGVKTAMLLGLKCRVLEVSENDAYALRGETVKLAYEEDRNEGLWPFCLCASFPFFGSAIGSKDPRQRCMHAIMCAGPCDRRIPQTCPMIVQLFNSNISALTLLTAFHFFQQSQHSAQLPRVPWTEWMR